MRYQTEQKIVTYKVGGGAFWPSHRTPQYRFQKDAPKQAEEGWRVQSITNGTRNSLGFGAIISIMVVYVR
jgi:hypothetical protein